MILFNVKHAFLLTVRRVILTPAFAPFAKDIMVLRTTLAHHVMIFIAESVQIILPYVLFVGVFMV